MIQFGIHRNREFVKCLSHSLPKESLFQLPFQLLLRVHYEQLKNSCDQFGLRFWRQIHLVRNLLRLEVALKLWMKKFFKQMVAINKYFASVLFIQNKVYDWGIGKISKKYEFSYFIDIYSRSLLIVCQQRLWIKLFLNCHARHFDNMKWCCIYLIVCNKMSRVNGSFKSYIHW